MQLEFKFSKDSIYFIVSVKFISEWREFCLSTDTKRLSPHSMNYELYENNELKKGLLEKVDFELVN